MANKKNMKKGPVKRGGRPKRSSSAGFSGMMMAIVALGGFAVVSPGASGAIFICMLPTFVLLFGNSDGLQMMRAQCVGYLNAAAAVPFVYSIYMGDSTLVSEFMNMRIILVSWGAAVVGTFLQFIAPFLATAFLQFLADEKLSKLLTAREKLIEIWGPEVAGDKTKGL